MRCVTIVPLGMTKLVMLFQVEDKAGFTSGGNYLPGSVGKASQFWRALVMYDLSVRANSVHFKLSAGIDNGKRLR